MSSSHRVELVVFGFMRNYCQSINVELPTHDLIHLFAEWLSLMDRWDKDHCHQCMVITDCKATQPATGDHFATCVGQYVIKKGDKQTWKLRIAGSDALVGILEDKIIKSHGKDIGDFTNKLYEGYRMNSLDGWRYHDAQSNFRSGRH